MRSVSFRHWSRCWRGSIIEDFFSVACICLNWCFVSVYSLYRCKLRWFLNTTTISLSLPKYTLHMAWATQFMTIYMMRNRVFVAVLMQLYYSQWPRVLFGGGQNSRAELRARSIVVQTFCNCSRKLLSSQKIRTISYQLLAMGSPANSGEAEGKKFLISDVVTYGISDISGYAL